MDQVTEAAVADLEARVMRLESEHHRAAVRTTVGGGGGFEIPTVTELPALPRKKQIVFLVSVDQAALPDLVPAPSYKDTYWWAGKEDVRWHPFGGKFVDIDGDPGDYSVA